MATIKLEPINTTSIRNNLVVITGIRPADHDCIVGQYWIGQDGPHNALWNLSGIMRDGSDATNLNMNSEDMKEIAKLLRKLGADS